MMDFQNNPGHSSDVFITKRETDKHTDTLREERKLQQSNRSDSLEDQVHTSVFPV